MATFIEGLTAAQCWACGHFYRLFFADSISLNTGEVLPKMASPLGNPETEGRARIMAGERLPISFSETIDYGSAAQSGAAFKPSKHAVLALLERGSGMVDAPVHVMVPNKASRLDTAGIICHVSSATPRPGSFVRGYDEDMLIAGPELCVLQLALKMPLPKLAQLVTELCSTYYFILAESSDLERGEDGALRTVSTFRKRACSNRAVPVSCLWAMGRWSEQCTSSKAGRAMARAVRYAVEGSASPMETALALMLSLPKNLGGYGLPKPQMNWVILVDAGSQLVRVADLFWPEASIALEYDSDAFHTEKEKIRLDSLRRNQLGAQSVTVFTATAQHLSTLDALDELAAQLSRVLGRPLHRNRLAPPARRETLLHMLKHHSLEGLR